MIYLLNLLVLLLLVFVSFLFLKIIVFVVSRIGAENAFTTVCVSVLRRNSTISFVQNAGAKLELFIVAHFQKISGKN